MSVSGGAPARCLSEISEEELTVRLSIDLVAAGRRNIRFLKLVAESHWLHQKPTIIEAIRRYDELWMPLISDLTVELTPPAILPPLDIEWVWYCHCLNPVSYMQYCESKFSKLIGKPAIFNEENEDYALNRCQEIWIEKYPTEPFENEIDINSKDQSVVNEHLLDLVLKYKSLYDTFSEPYMPEIVYLIAAKQRYKGFIYMIERFGDKCSVLVPTKDILLLWLTHQSYPTVYNADMKEMEEKIEKVVRAVRAGEFVKEEEVEDTKKSWELTFGQPYEKAGCPTIGRVVKENPPVYWDIVDNDVNTKYKSLFPRFLLESVQRVLEERWRYSINSKMGRPNYRNTRRFLVIYCRFYRSSSSTEKVVGTATPKVASEGWQSSWKFSNGDELDIRCESSASTSLSLFFDLKNQESKDSSVRFIDSSVQEPICFLHT